TSASISRSPVSSLSWCCHSGSSSRVSSPTPTEDSPSMLRSATEARPMAGALPMAGKVVLITGGTGGIGKATAIGLAAIGARVGITGRDLARAEQAAADIRSASENPAVDAFAADMTSQAEVRRLAATVLDAYPRLHVLVNNVGGFWAHRHPTADGLERTFALNHLAPFLFTNELARRLDGAGVTATSVHPGVVRTNFGAEDQAWFFTIISRVVRPLLKTPAQGAQTPIYLASSPDMDGISGQFFVNRKPKTPNKLADDTELTGS